MYMYHAILILFSKTKALEYNNMFSFFCIKEKDDRSRPLSRHGHWRPRLYRDLSVQLPLHKYKSPSSRR